MNAVQNALALEFHGTYDSAYFDQMRRIGHRTGDNVAEWMEPTGDASAAISPASRPHVGLGEYLEAVEAFACRYIAFPSEDEGVLLALWVAHTHLVEQFETSPILAVTSAEKRSGKTRTLDVLELLVQRPFRVVVPSEAVVYTILGQRPRRTMLLDEADAIFGTRTSDRMRVYARFSTQGTDKEPLCCA